MSQHTDLIQRIEEVRGSRVVTYVTGDRKPVGANIGEDALRPLYEHLRAIGKCETIDLFLYSRGGSVDTPWRIANALRQVSDRWNILIPFRANSAATLLALGADNIVLGQQGELGPIDPTLNWQQAVPQPGGGYLTVEDSASVEDVMAYVRFVQDRVGLSDQTGLATLLAKLTDRLDATTLGNIYRTHAHIRDVAARMLNSHNEALSPQSKNLIIETLAEKVYAHGHAVGVGEAKEIGLRAEMADPTLDQLMWDLMGAYEVEMELLSPIDPRTLVGDGLAENTQIEVVMAAIESTAGSSRFTGTFEAKGRRTMPQALNVSVNFNVQLADPDEVIDPAQREQLQQTIAQNVLGIVGQQAHDAVMNAMRAQAPLVAIDTHMLNARWTTELAPA